MPRNAFEGWPEDLVDWLSESFKRQDHARSEVSSSSDSLESAMHEIDGRIAAVEQSIAALRTSLPTALDTPDTDFARVLDDRVAPIAAEVASLRTDSASALNQTRATLQQAETAIRASLDFQVNVLKDSYQALNSRLEALEDKAKESRSTLIAIASLAVALAGGVFGCVGLFIALYVALSG